MGNVTQMPNKPVRSWFVFEKELREFLMSLPVEIDEIDHVCSVMRPTFLKYAACDFSSDDSMSQGETLNALNDWVQNLVAGLLMVLATREIELYRLRGTS